MFPGMLLPGQLLPELRGTENDCDVSLALDVLHEVTLQEGVLIRDNLEKVLKKGVGRQGGEVPLQSGEDHQLHFQQLGQLIGVIRVLDQGSPGHRARLHQLASNEDCGRSHQLELPLTDTNLTEESVHDVAREQEDVNVTVLITTNLTRKS